MDNATRAQVRAANPAESTWLSANAGSGKTSVLTDRVARLLLGGTQPQRILCLTYTKAAAAEMQNRLFKTLGAWAMMPEAELTAALRKLDPDCQTILSDNLAAARRLFARAIETPGGLKIQTIHSFCGGLLRRFPLEAGVSPQFTEMDDRMARLMRDEILEDMSDHLAPDAAAGLAALCSEGDLEKVIGDILRHRSAFVPPPDEATIRAAFGAGPGLTREFVLSQVFLGDEAHWIPQVIATMAAGSVTNERNAKKLVALDFSVPSMALLGALCDCLLTQSGKAPFTAKIGTFYTKEIGAALGGTKDKLDYLMQRVEAHRPDFLTLGAIDRAQAQHRFAAAFLPEYDRRKLVRGWLDFDDLILRARDLLSDSAMAQWVLFRLDGGIDHILVDEAQDTSPDQWRVIELLTQEFTAGQGAREVGRTVFVVGDKKQSIYSFQGADLAKFDEMQGHFTSRMQAIGQEMHARELLYSFRSSPAVLSVVDRSLAQAAPMGRVEHLAFFDQMPGRVDLWPVLPDADKPQDPEWFRPVDALPPRAAAVVLAEEIAAEIERLVTSGTQITLRRETRPMRYGDVLILVQRRSAMFQEVIRACKARGLPIAGADRLKLGAELAVKDLTALIAFLDTPEDDLSLAAALRSPLFGWSEAQLYDLAQPRGRQVFLWEALREGPVQAATVEVLKDLQKVAEFLRPYELIDRMLTRHRGRERLIARLGPEAEDGIDQFLALAMNYERLEVPSLTGFLTWLAAEEVEAKRQSDTASDRIRVMTVHGAKGLEAPVVILPDTADRKAPSDPLVVRLENGLPVWKGLKNENPPAIEAALAAESATRMAERDRLLYVAMTRAESWLIVAAAGKADKEDGWHQKVAAGLAACGAAPIDTPVGQGLRVQQGVWPEDLGAVQAPAAVQRPALPDWTQTPVPEPIRPIRPLSPSNLGGAKALPGETEVLDIDAAMARGSALHLLLEVLPAHPAAHWPALAQRLVPDWADDLLPEAVSVLQASDLAPIFAPGTLTEVEVRTRMAGQEMVGSIDRLVVGPGRVLVVDYKSNQIVPERAEDIPEGLLRQLAAYRLALQPVYPGREIKAVILWTRPARLMPVPEQMLAAAAVRAGLVPAGESLEGH